MSMHIGFIAVKASVFQFRKAFSEVWPKYEVIAYDENLVDADTMWTWKKSHEQFVSAADWSKENPGKQVYVFWQDGIWAIMYDESYTLAADEEALKLLSAKLGTVLSFIVETHSGCAFFWNFESGILRRMIQNIDTELTTDGAPLREETGIDISNYYMDETEALWKAFGLSPVHVIPPNGIVCQAISVIDRTDYSKPDHNVSNITLQPDKETQKYIVGQSEPQQKKKQWWRFW